MLSISPEAIQKIKENFQNIHTEHGISIMFQKGFYEFCHIYPESITMVERNTLERFTFDSLENFLSDVHYELINPDFAWLVIKGTVSENTLEDTLRQLYKGNNPRVVEPQLRASYWHQSPSLLANLAFELGETLNLEVV